MEIDWTRYLGEQLGEHKNIDFKAACAWAGGDRANLAADIIAMSNTDGGGVLVIGVQEDSAKKLLLQGCSPDQLATFDRTPVIDFLSRHAQPEAKLTIEKPTMDGRTVVVLRVSEFQETPLIVTSDLQYQDEGNHNKLAARAGEVLIRTGAAQTTTIRSADDMRALMRRSLLKTREVLLFGIRELLNAEARTAPGPSDIHAAAREQWSKRVGEWTRKVGDVPTLAVEMVPTADLSAQVPALGDLSRRVLDAEIRTPEHQFPGSAYGTPTNLDEAIEWRLADVTVWQAHKRGAFFYADVMVPALKLPADRPGVLMMWLPCYQAAAALQFAGRYYKAFADDVDLSIKFTFANVRGVRLSDNGQGILPFREEQDCESHVATFAEMVSTSPSKLVAGWEIEATRVVQGVFERFNVPDPGRRARQYIGSLRGARSSILAG